MVMKTIEQKAKDFDKALTKARKYYEETPNNVYKAMLENLFPELAESEDEKIRKHLIDCVTRTIPEADAFKEISKEQILAWLEKQEGCEYIKKDWLEHIKQSWYKEGFIDGKYSGGTSKERTINDAATLKELIDFLENGTAKLQHDLTRYANWLKNQFIPIEKQGEHAIACSKEQMKVLDEILNFAANHESPYWNYYIFETLNGFIRQLKN
jgi:adenylate kinase family enzyme